jgi:Zn-finger nucleic acid-binding protein
MRLLRDQGLMICDYCGSQAAPRLDEEGVLVLEPVKHSCSLCAEPLSGASLFRASIEGHELLYCTRCHGMLFDMEQFYSIVQELREHRYWSRSTLAPRGPDSERVVMCPLCHKDMDRHPYGGGGNVAVDSCEQCGVLWLDRGELSRIVAAPDREQVFYPTAELPPQSMERV